METIAIIGAGPLGIELHVALRGAGLRVLHLDARQIGGTIAWWPPGTRWFSSPERISIAGVPLVTPGGEKATREEYLAYLRSVVEQFGLRIQTYTRVTALQRQPNGFLLRARRSVQGQFLGPEQTFHVPRVILATGGTETANSLGIPGEDLPHVSHYFQDPHAFFRQRLLIVGGRNSAIEAALCCHRAGAQVSLSYRRPELDKASIKYWLYPEFSSLVKAGRIGAYFGTTPTRITEDHITLRRANGETLDVPADFVLLLTGYRADMTLFQAAGVKLQPPQQVPQFDPQTMETNVPGLYVAGTAIAGTQDHYRVFLENCVIVHAARILAHLARAGVCAPEAIPALFRQAQARPQPEMPEA